MKKVSQTGWWGVGSSGLHLSYSDVLKLKCPISKIVKPTIFQRDRETYEADNCSDVKRRKEDIQFNIFNNFPQHQVLGKLGPGQLGPGPNLLRTQHQSQ